MQLFTAQTADGNSQAIRWPGGEGTYNAEGTFGGGTATLQFSPDGGTTWKSCGSDAELSSDGAANFKLPVGYHLRVSLSGASGANLDAWVNKMIETPSDIVTA